MGWLAAAVLVGQSPIVGGIVAGLALALAATLGLILRRPNRGFRTAATPRASRWVSGGAVVGSLVVVGGLAIAAGLHTAALRAGPVQELATGSATVTVRLKIDGDPSLRQSTTSRRPPYVVVRATVEEIRSRAGTEHAIRERVRTPVLVVGTAKWEHVRYGQHVDASGRLEQVEGGAEVAAMLSTRSPPQTVDEPPWWLREAEQVRAGLRDAVAGEPEDVRGLVPALVMGDVSGVSTDLNADFQTTGLTHLSAVSGTNLTLLLAFLLPLARLIGVRARGLTAVGLSTVVVFIVLARPQPSVLRAAAMGLIALAAMTSGGGRRRAVRSLSVAVIVLLLLDTSLARSAGFALSVLATAGIILLGPGWRDALAKWMPGWLADAISCPLAAQLACTPVVAWLSGEVSLIAVAANLLAGPMVGPATIFGFVAAGVALVSSQLAQVVGWAAGWPARWIILVAREGADLPGAANAWPATVVGVAVLSVLCLALVLGLHRILARPIAMILAVILLAVVVLRPVGSLGWPPDDWLFVACDVGQGDGLVLRAGDRTAVVVDTGPDPAAMDRCLKDLDVQYVPVVVLSHFHADHVGGLAGVLNDRRVDEIEVTPYFSPRAEYDRVVDLASQHGVVVRTVAFREQRVVGKVRWTTLWPAKVPALPPPGTSSATSTDEGSPENNASIAMMVELDGLRILLTGDLEPESQRAVVASGADLRADVLKVPHHGSAQQDPAFIAAANARLALISAGRDNDYGHPAPRTLDLLSHDATRTATTNVSGALIVTNTNNHLALTTHPRLQEGARR
ncbi:ComEC/Rec2 family competence protein [Kribbella sp. VKM Ac-2569]|uniref:ComEC/Rec2 family competence protein n=1 Tax=Kribbella sp. VKM Ac-2569 TaxID=2512220 RepID=UPI001F5421D7|nr:ComEC/Rec2 family competence protein [Kribbella sp. VKM Ac-2569]